MSKIKEHLTYKCGHYKVIFIFDRRNPFYYSSTWLSKNRQEIPTQNCFFCQNGELNLLLPENKERFWMLYVQKVIEYIEKYEGMITEQVIINAFQEGIYSFCKNAITLNAEFKLPSEDEQKLIHAEFVQSFHKRGLYNLSDSSVDVLLVDRTLWIILYSYIEEAFNEIMMQLMNTYCVPINPQNENKYIHGEDFKYFKGLFKRLYPKCWAEKVAKEKKTWEFYNPHKQFPLS